MTPGMVTLDCADPRALAKFWTEAAGYVVAHDFDGEYLVLVPAGPADLPAAAGSSSGGSVGSSSAPAAAGSEAAAEAAAAAGSESAAAAAPRGLALGLQRVPEPRTGKNRAHIDWQTDDRPAEVGRLVALGATVLAEHEMPGFGWTVLADPDGNEFCVGG